ncbi:Mo-dependent nitrogenase C-terminal domain-containing protein [Oculatella sp. LEGE 06141]|uniref:Mo-dependent nitrogenase C-terminal domain-containing protein n=1 Tax=Oculatella sp. LEGE 06141 TaxID=1828648 RepID=UPI001881C6E0|nr:Mo-dependent nitrogenase C-terminal domain-containing protein [Oculatella sp. LEGE 06141]MBE9182801.1 Mo-dependent nitrogenase C-terminal domain-containing protein [Oculatella sp. LEGE 06141]
MLTTTCTVSKADCLKPLRDRLDAIDVRNPQMARLVCKVIPAACPFERDIKFFNRVLFHIPPLCKLNPLYEETVGLRFRALSYLADECGEDVTSYC